MCFFISGLGLDAYYARVVPSPTDFQAALLNFYRGATDGKRRVLDQLSPIQLREHYVELLSNGTIYQRRQIIAELANGKIQPLDKERQRQQMLPSMALLHQQRQRRREERLFRKQKVLLSSRMTY